MDKIPLGAPSPCPHPHPQILSTPPHGVTSQGRGPDVDHRAARLRQSTPQRGITSSVSAIDNGYEAPMVTPAARLRHPCWRWKCPAGVGRPVPGGFAPRKVRSTSNRQALRNLQSARPPL